MTHHNHSSRRVRWPILVFALVLSAVSLADTGCTKKKKAQPGPDGAPSPGQQGKKARQSEPRVEPGVRLI